jgi:outer membrane biosynthesis protein TonB
MSNTTRLALVSLLLIAVVLGLASCGDEPEPTTVAQATTAPAGPAEADTAQPEPTEPPTQAPTEPVAPTTEPTETPVPPTETPEPTNTPEPVVDDSACITCHTTEETLQALAVEEEVAELSEGEG